MMINLSSAVAHWAKCAPGRVCLQRGDMVKSYRDLDNLAERVSTILDKFEKDIVVVVSLDNQYYFLGCVVACIRTARIFALVDSHNPESYCEALFDNNKRFLVVTDSDYAPTKTDWIIRLPQELDTDHEDTAEHHAKGEVHTVLPYRPSGILFTSGTTGKPVGLVRTNYSFFSEAVLWIIELRLAQDLIFTIGRPLFWTASFVFSYATLLSGGTIRVDERDDELVLAAISSQISHISFFTPIQIERIYQTRSSIKKFTASILTMGAPIAPDLKISIAKEFDCNIIESWGTSEGLGTITSPSDVFDSPDSIGHACFCDKLVVINDNDEELNAGEQGILAGWSDNQFSMLLSEDVDLSSEVGSGQHRMLISGDIGKVDTKGNFRLYGRLADRIVFEGIHIFPSEVEKVISVVDGVCDCAFGIVEEGFNEPRAFLLVTMQSKISLSSREDKIRKELSKIFEHPINAAIIPQGNIPRNRNGKISRDLASEIAIKSLGSVPAP